MSTLTAKDFHEPLLQVMADLTGGTAGKPVRGEDTYGPVMAKMGIPDILAHGTEAASGQPMVARWIQWACKNLRVTGRMGLEGRGQWVLTAKGIQEALGAPVVTPASVPPALAPAAASLPTPAPVPPAVTPAPVQPAYFRDPYLLGLILAQTACVGHYTPHKGAECATCPIASPCRNKQYATYSRTAFHFAELDAKAAKAKAAQAALANTALAANLKPQPTPAPSPQQADKRKVLEDPQPITAFEESKCSECGKPIPKGSRCYWVDDTSSANPESLIMHVECYQAAVKS